MDFNEYQEKAFETAIYPEKGTGSKLALSYAALGVVNEAGEVAGKIKKYLRGDVEWTKEARLAALDEVGDVQWYLAALVEELGFNLELAASRNIEKLTDRKDRGVLKGNGDTR